jgi:glycosyltransferase involved in cell wall biosynthesis
MTKKCLIVSYYFPPTGGSGVQRMVKLIKYASRKNWSFTVISARERSEFQPKDQSFFEELPKDVKIIRTEAPLPAQKISVLNKIGFFKKSSYWKRWIGAFVQIPDSRRGWNDRVKRSVLEEINKDRYDCLLVTAPPYSLTLLVLELQEQLEIPVILDMRDPWSSHPYKLHPTFIHRYLNRMMERKTIGAIKNGTHAYKYVVNDYKKWIPNFNSDNWSVIPNGYDEDDFSDLRRSDSGGGDHRFNIAFLGMIHADINSPKYLLRAINYLKTEDREIGHRIHFHHIGRSAVPLETIVRRYGLQQQVTLWGYRSHREALEIINRMDALFQIHNPDYKGSEFIVGGKMYEYLRLRKPILSVVPENGEVADIIRECRCGEVVNSTNAKDIAGALLRIIKDGDRSYGYIGIEKYCREREAEKFIAVFEKAIREKNRE